ncbi:MAG TPA: hypothetical protein VN626_11000 [Clostridia bacterium]|nr:hypothetical protein [Clostridia bacterium]
MDKYTKETVARVKEAFKNHKATLTECGNGISILQWSRPNTNCYAIRYVMDGGRLYITGDLGEAVFCLTWKATVNSFKDVSFDYFHEKLQAIKRGEDYDFSEEKAIESIKYYFGDSQEEWGDEERDYYQELLDAPKDCNSPDNWAFWLNTHDGWSDINPDACEWLYDCGNIYSFWFIAYLIGLKMAAAQLAEQAAK